MKLLSILRRNGITYDIYCLLDQINTNNSVSTLLVYMKVGVVVEGSFTPGLDPEFKLIPLPLPHKHV